MKMLRKVGSFAVVGMAVLAASSDSRGQGGKMLTSVQTAAQDAMREQVKEVLEKAKAACGPDFKLVTDYENYDEAPWLTDRFVRGNPERARMMAATACGAALDVAARLCAKPDAPDPGARGGKPKGGGSRVTPLPPVDVKGVSCLFQGAEAKGKDDDEEDFVRRNASFTGGILTIHPVVDMSNVDLTLQLVGRGRAKAGNLIAGKACERGGQCRSNLCRAKVCVTCDAKNACPSGFFCDRGSCWNESSGDDEPSRPSSGSRGAPAKPTKPAGKSSGSSCKFGSQCASKICTAKYVCK